MWINNDEYHLWCQWQKAGKEGRHRLVLDGVGMALAEAGLAANGAGLALDAAVTVLSGTGLALNGTR
jgi:hypothetical protein